MALTTSSPTSVITGAARGIGRALAIEAGARGHRVVVTGRSTDSSPSKALPGTLDEVVHTIRAAGGEAESIRADLTDPEDVTRISQFVIERYGGCDILVNNAALSFTGRLLDLPARRWAPVMAVNLTAPVNLIHALLPQMLERGNGVILNLSSGAAVHDHVPELAYAATKAALERLSFGLHSEYGGRGVAFQCLRIDELVVTEAVALAAPELPADMPRHTPEDVATALLWMLGQPSLSGEVLTMADLRAAGRLGPGTSPLVQEVYGV